MLEFLRSPIFGYSALGVLLVSIACAFIGPFVYVRRMSFMAGGISHALLGGLGFALFVGLSPLWGALMAAIIAALILAYLSIRFPRIEDTVISALWSTGMALGVIFIAVTPGYATDLMSYLFGNILMLTPELLFWMGILVAVLSISLWVLYPSLLALSFDAEFSEVRGLPVHVLNTLFMILLSVGLVLMVQAVGMMMVIAFLTLPSATARLWSRTVPQMMLSTFVLGLVAGLSGLSLSYALGWPSGATIVLLLALTYTSSLLYALKRR